MYGHGEYVLEVSSVWDSHYLPHWLNLPLSENNPSSPQYLKGMVWSVANIIVSQHSGTDTRREDEKIKNAMTYLILGRPGLSII